MVTMISKSLQTLLQKYHLSQRKLAERSGVNYVTINRILNDYKFRVTSDTVEKITRGLGCTVEEKDVLLRAIGRVPEEIQAKYIENPKIALLYRYIAKMNSSEIERLLNIVNKENLKVGSLGTGGKSITRSNR
jgi:transcriptional regulator with XRE-family HTH domain